MKIKQMLMGVLALGCACAFGENTKDGESSGVAVQKLQTCDFLLNKDFKKNAKYYLCLFSASWCPPCRAEMPRIAKTYAETLKDDPNIELIHFSCDQNDEKALAWAKEHDVKFPVVKPNGGNPLDLRARGIPHLFIVKADGTLIEEGHPMKLFTEEKLNALKAGELAVPETATEKTRKAIAKLFPGWSLDTEVYDHDWAGIQPFIRGKSNVTFVHPKNRETPSVISRTLKLPDINPCLALCVASWHDDADFSLSVRVNGKDVLTNRLVCTPDAVPWEDIVVPLSAWRGSMAKIEIVFSACNRWTCEFPCLARVDIIEADGDMSINEGKWEVDGYTWSYRAQNGEATIVAENDGRFSAVSPCPVGSIAIPATIAGAKVTHIGREAFRDCSTMTSVIIPEGVSRIGREAFRDCTGLKSIKIPSSVQIIERDAFLGCNGLASVSIPEGVTSIERGAFHWCCGLGSIEIPPSVTHIGRDAFTWCLGLSSVTIPENVTDIGPQAFRVCKALASVRIPASVTNVWDTAFCDTYALTSFHVDPGNRFYKSENGLLLTKDGTTLVRGVNGDATIPPSVTAIGNCAFEGCVALWSVEIPSGVKSIGSFAFKQCRGMKSVTIPSSVTDIGQQSFFGCNALTSVTMCGERPNAPNNIFERCGNLKSIHVPANAKSWAGMEDDWQGIPLVFDGAAEQQKATVDGYTWSYRVENGKATIVAEKDGKYSCAVSPAPTGDLKIPATLGGVKVTRLGSWVFSGCSGLKSVTIPDNVTSIGRRAFCGCSSLTSVTIPNSVTNIDENAFGGRMPMPRSLSILGRPLNARGNEPGGFSGIKSFSVAPDNPSYSSRNGMLCSKDGSILIVGVNGDVVIPECVTSIGNGAFASCTNLTSVTIPNGVTSIGSMAFSGCTGLKSVTIPDSVTNIDSRAFDGCKNIASVDVVKEGKVEKVSFQDFCKQRKLSGAEGSLMGRRLLGHRLSGGSFAARPSGGSLRERRVLREQARKEELAKEKELEAKRRAEAAAKEEERKKEREAQQREAEREEQRRQLLQIQEELRKAREVQRQRAEQATVQQHQATVDGYTWSYRVENSEATIVAVSPKPEGTLVCPNIIEGHKVTGIDRGAFNGCDKMTKIMLPEHLETLPVWVSGWCIHGSIFYGCTALSSIGISETNPKFASVDGALYSKDKKVLFAYPKDRTEIKVCRETTSIQGDAFHSSLLFKKINIPEGISYTGGFAFSACPNLEEVIFPKEFGSINHRAFSYCPKMKKVVFLGDAPEAYWRRTASRENVFYGAARDIVVYVRKGSKGWNGKDSTDLPDRWPLDGSDSRPIRYIDEAAEKMNDAFSLNAAPGSITDLDLGNVAPLQFVYCPAGKFSMGYKEQPAISKVKDIEITSPFWVSKIPIRADQLELLGLNSITNAETGDAVINDASIVVQKLPSVLKERFGKMLPPGYVFRLPTEAEFEYLQKAETKDKDAPTNIWGVERLYSGGLIALLDRAPAYGRGVDVVNRRNRAVMTDLVKVNYENQPDKDPVGWSDDPNWSVFRRGLARNCVGGKLITSQGGRFLYGFYFVVAPDINKLNKFYWK